MRFNINHYVEVKLTDVGREIYYKHMTDVLRGSDYKMQPIKENAEGWSRWQLWDLMSIFGAHCYNGCRVPFETEIEIVEM